MPRLQDWIGKNSLSGALLHGTTKKGHVIVGGNDRNNANPILYSFEIF